MRTFAKRFFIIILVVGAGLLALFTLTNYSDGERAGNITKLSRKGVIFKTWEGSLDMGIYQGAKPKTGNVENTIWDFSVADADVAHKIQEANARGNRVVLHYEEKYMKIFWVGDSKYVVTSVEEVMNPNAVETAPAPPQQQKSGQQAPTDGNVPVENL
jgi:hypothetical protein